MHPNIQFSYISIRYVQVSRIVIVLRGVSVNKQTVLTFQKDREQKNKQTAYGIDHVYRMSNDNFFKVIECEGETLQVYKA